MKYLLMTLTLLGASVGFAQQDQSSFGISFNGFVKTDMFYDSRQTVALREGHLLLYPQAELPDANGSDINAKGSFNMLSIQTRLTGKITGPDAFGAKTSGTIEGEFFGHSEADVNGFRLRHSYIKLDWVSSSLLIGQTWHPMFVAEMYPGVVSFNTGAPFQPFSRNPQIRFSYSMGPVKTILAAMSQRDFTNDGPSGLTNSYLRNAVLPNLHLQVQFASDNLLLGAGVDYKTLKPRLYTSKTANSPKVKTNETISGLAGLGYARLNIDQVMVKTEVALGNTLSDHLMLGGYAVHSTDTTTGKETYTPLSVFSAWTDISTGSALEFGLFAGYTKNLGADKIISGSYYGRGTTIGQVFRVSPRIVWNSGKTRLAAELEYTQAGYGTPDDKKKGVVVGEKAVANLRGLIGVYYFF